jgi:sulfate adenylyltransferase subunit 1
VRLYDRESVTITIADDIDISRGDMLVRSTEEPVLEIRAPGFYLLDGQSTCWILQSRTLFSRVRNGSKAKVTQVNFVQDTATLQHLTPSGGLKMNEIAQSKS